MSATPDTSLGRRSIEEILLEHGHVTREQVDEVIAAEPEAGRPLGQILVEAGTITRLQLASALAEQWSDSGAPIAPPLGLALSGSSNKLEPLPAPPTPDQSELLSRLRHVEETLLKLATSDGEDESAAFNAAVAEISERLSSAEPAIEELGRRFEALAADTSRDGRVDELFVVVGELHERLGSVGQTVDVAVRQSEQLTADAAAEIERVREELSALTARLPELAEGQEVQLEEVEKLRALFDELSQRPAGDPDLAGQVEDLGAVVQTLSERPSSDPALTSQLDTLALRLAEIGTRVDVLSAAVQSTSGDDEALQELKNALGELAQRPLADPVADRRVDELAAALEELAQRPQFDPAVDVRIAELGVALEELAERPVVDPAAEQRLDALAAALDELGSSVAALVAKPDGDPAVDEKLFEVTARLEELERADVLDELRARLVELAERPAFDPALVDRLAELETRFGALPATEVLAELGDGDRALGDRIDGVAARVDEVADAIEQLAGSQVSREVWNEATTAINDRIDGEKDLDIRLTGLEVRLAQMGSNGATRAAADPKLGAQIAALDARVEQLAAGVAASPAPTDGSEAAPTTSSSVATPATLERDVEHVLMAIERLSVHLGAHERALTELMGASGVVAQVRELGARVGDLETYGGGSGSDGSGEGGGGGGDGGEMRAEIRSLMRRLDAAESSAEEGPRADHRAARAGCGRDRLAPPAPRDQPRRRRARSVARASPSKRARLGSRMIRSTRLGLIRPVE